MTYYLIGAIDMSGILSDNSGMKLCIGVMFVIIILNMLPAIIGWVSDIGG